MRLLLFTDTLFDINGVSRFILNIANQARLAFPGGAADQLHILTSTRFPCPPGFEWAADAERPGGTIHNLPPRWAGPMPGYPQLEVVWPPARAMTALADRLRPDVIHISTPGPIGSLGRRYALKRGLPLLGTYHTDFPAYIDHLFDDRTLTWLTTIGMRRFYAPFSRLFTRSTEYAEALVRLGIDRRRIVRLAPGIDTSAFGAHHRPANAAAARAFWSTYPGVDPDAVKVIYVGRISLEKNLPFLTAVWRALGPTTPKSQLIIVGDGPYRAQMERELAGTAAAFLGFRYADELAALYAAADLFAFPSTTDTLGQVVMEAQASGLPVIVTDQGGPSEVVCATDGPARTGYVLPATDAAAWAATLRTLIADALLRTRLGAAAATLISRMTIRRSFEAFWQVHQDALAQTGAPTSAKEQTGPASMPRPVGIWSGNVAAG